MSRPRPGVTLIEILAGLVILGTLLVSIAIARGRFLRQIAEADRRLTAIHSADALLAAWMSGPAQNVPLAAQGALDQTQNFTWRTRVIRNPDATRVDAMLVRLEVFDRSTAAANAMASPAFAVDFLLHDYRLPPPPTQGAK
jgi:prepilin-type N-terminal cleavage/methylation domain-containing protein